MCGSSSAQNQISDEQNAFYKQLTSEYGTEFGENQNILGALTKSFTPTLQAGPNQLGYSDAQKTALDSQAGEGTALGYAQAQKGTAEALAARGGGNAFTPSGADNQILAQNANLAAQQQASDRNSILSADYAQGNANYNTAAGALGGVAEQYSPTAFAGATTSAGSTAASTANQIASQNNSVWQGVLGAAGALGGSAATAYAGR